MRLSCTVASPFERSGIGVHTGTDCRARVEPAVGTGLRFVVDGVEIPATLAHARAVPGATVLERDGARLHTSEHLLAALYGAGITDARIVVEGPEIPVLDGSALPWSDALAEVGLLAGPPVEERVVSERIEVEAAGGRAILEPFDGCAVRVVVEFGTAARGSAAIVLEGDRFRHEVAFARTFALERDVERLRAAGRGRGASLANTLVLTEDGSVRNPEGPRSPDEAVRHKLLDAIGDLALAGPVRGLLVVERGSHVLHHALLRRWLG